MLLPLMAGRPNCNWALIEWSDLLNRRWKFSWVSNFGEVKLQVKLWILANDVLDYWIFIFGFLPNCKWNIAYSYVEFAKICGFCQIMCCLTSKFTWISPNDVLLLSFLRTQKWIIAHNIRWMEEILHHLGWFFNPRNNGINHNWCRNSSIHSIINIYQEHLWLKALNFDPHPEKLGLTPTAACGCNCCCNVQQTIIYSDY